jgi:hypothetical protein
MPNYLTAEQARELVDASGGPRTGGTAQHI